MENISILDAGIVALLGYAVVFVGLIALQAVVVAMARSSWPLRTSRRLLPLFPPPPPHLPQLPLPHPWHPAPPVP